MVQNLARVLFLLLLCPFVANAQLESTFRFNGQNSEVLKAQQNIVVVTPEVVDVPSTCSRQVPIGERQVCHNETRYDRQCTWIPPRQNCYDESYRVCNPVTRTRQECSNGPSRQVCTQIPSRQVCTERPTREVCTTRPDGRRICSQVGGGRSCTQVGGGQSCSTVPGERICRNVTYTEQDCRTAYRNRCDHIPGRDDCRDVPYSVPVCNMEMQYRTEQYACTRQETIDRKENKVLKNTINVQVMTNGLVEEFPLLISVKESSREFKSFSINAKLQSEPSVLVYLSKKTVKVISETATEIQLESNVILEVVSKEMLPIDFPAKILSAEIDKKAEKMTIVFDGSISAMGNVEFTITHKAFLGSTKTIASLNTTYPSAEIELGQVGQNIAMKIDMKKAMKRELKSKDMKLKVKLSSESNIPGEILNSQKPEMSKQYTGTFVKVK